MDGAARARTSVGFQNKTNKNETVQDQVQDEGDALIQEPTTSTELHEHDAKNWELVEA